MKSKLLILWTGLCLLGPLGIWAQPKHDTWDDLLQKHVDDQGRVHYAGFKADEALLDAYLEELSKMPAQRSWSRSQQLAYWINAYNAFTVKLILDHYPVQSIRDIHDGNPWAVHWIKIGGTKYSLDQIEHQIIRPQFKDARIHFAVNCAARSCPPLLNKAYNPVVLEQQLRNQTRKFVNHTGYNQLGPDKVRISKIFDWYKTDFGDLIDYLNRYAEQDIRPQAELQFNDYDWSLNSR